MPPTIPNALARLPLAGSNFSWIFLDSDDRLGHGLHGPDFESLLIQSVESKPEHEQAGPASPVFQHVHEEDLKQGPARMTVGQWGKIHFSGVFLQTAPGTVHCDIAARVRTAQAVPLASTYTVSRTSSNIISADESAIVLDVPELSQILRITAGPGSRMVMAEAGRSALRVQILPSVLADTEASARTIQWSYTIELVNASDFV